MIVKLQKLEFEGPLELLLYLIKKEEMDIFNIDIHAITEQYLGFLQDLQNLDLEKAGDFIKMASHLIYIKSQLLIPKPVDDELEEDPRSKLVAQLLLYESFRKSSKKLYSYPIVGRDIWTRAGHLPYDMLRLSRDTDEIVLKKEDKLFQLAKSFKKYMYKKPNQGESYSVGFPLMSISERLKELKDCINKNLKLRLSQLIGFRSKAKSLKEKTLITFLSLLELSRLGFVRVFQPDAFSEISIEPKQTVTDSIFETLESEALDVKKEEEDLWN